MRVTITGISRIVREVESTPPQGSPTHSALSAIACWRCGGMLVEDHCMDMDLGHMERGQWARRCIQCGDMIDEIILRNRSASRLTLQEIRPTAESERRSLPCRFVTEKKGDMPRYLMPLLRSGIIRPCRPLSRFAKVQWLWPSIFRWLVLDRTGRSSARAARR